MEYPPNKRLKGQNYDTYPCADPFENDEDFTQDDLDEIDIIASQAFTGDVEVPGPKENVGSVIACPSTHSKLVSENRKTFGLGENCTVSSNVRQSNTGTCDERSKKEAFGNGQQYKENKEDLFYGRLEAQQTDLKKKLREVEEELLMKNGEIRVLRDSLKQTKQEKEQQRQVQLLLEKERAHVQSEKEKALSKKVQSLESELHFKEAEISEMKLKIQSNKVCALSGNRNSPRRCSSVALQQDGGGVSQPSPGVSPFLTKDTFAAQLSKRPSPFKVQSVNHFREDGKRLANETIGNIVDEARQGKFSKSDLIPCQESALLNLLLQHPLDPSKLGLCHLLCISPDALPGLLFQHNFLSSGSAIGSTSSSAESKVIHAAHNDFSQAQNLAMSGLNMLALAHHPAFQHAPDSGHEGQSISSRGYPGAPHLLPLLEYHISLFCRALETMESAGKSPLRESPLSGSSSEGSVASSVEESLGSLEEFALAALKALYHLLSQSTEVVQTLLSCQPQEQTRGKRNPEIDRPELGPSKAPGTSGNQRDGAVLQHPLFRRLLQLADPALASTARRSETVLTGSLTALNMLAERAGGPLLGRLKCLLSSQSMLRCLSMTSSYQTVCLSVSLLALTANSEEVAMLLSSKLDVCPLLRIYQYITSRPDKSITERQWSHLELEVVRLLTNLFTRKTAFVDSSCQCNNEVVRTLVVLLHRQWLALRRWEFQEGQNGSYPSPTVHLLKEALMLLHWLFSNESGFSERCVEVLHMYDQVTSAIRDGFRKIPHFTEIEELALEEMCRPEVEDAEDMDMDTGS